MLYSKTLKRKKSWSVHIYCMGLTSFSFSNCTEERGEVWELEWRHIQAININKSRLRVFFKVLISTLFSALYPHFQGTHYLWENLIYFCCFLFWFAFYIGWIDYNLWICCGQIYKTSCGGGCHAWGRSCLLYPEHLVVTLIRNQSNIHKSCYWLEKYFVMDLWYFVLTVSIVFLNFCLLCLVCLFCKLLVAWCHYFYLSWCC